MNENFTGVSGNEVFDKSVETLQPSVAYEFLYPITDNGVIPLSDIYGWSVRSDLVDPRG